MAGGPFAGHFQLPCLNRAMTGMGYMPRESSWFREPLVLGRAGGHHGPAEWRQGTRRLQRRSSPASNSEYIADGRTEQLNYLWNRTSRVPYSMRHVFHP
jgi:hypothetical protein